MYFSRIAAAALVSMAAVLPAEAARIDLASQNLAAASTPLLSVDPLTISFVSPFAGDASGFDGTVLATGAGTAPFGDADFTLLVSDLIAPADEIIGLSTQFGFDSAVFEVLFDVVSTGGAFDGISDRVLAVVALPAGFDPAAIATASPTAPVILTASAELFEVAQVPLPAGALLVLTGMAGLAVTGRANMRRRG